MNLKIQKQFFRENNLQNDVNLTKVFNEFKKIMPQNVISNASSQLIFLSILAPKFC